MGSLDGFLRGVEDFQPNALILGVPKLYIPYIDERNFSMLLTQSAARISPELNFFNEAAARGTDVTLRP